MEDRALRQHATGDVSLQSLELQQSADFPIRCALAYSACRILDPAISKVFFHVTGHVYEKESVLQSAQVSWAIHRPVRVSLTGVECHSHAIGSAQIPVVAQAGPEAVVEGVYGSCE